MSERHPTPWTVTALSKLPVGFAIRDANGIYICDAFDDDAARIVDAVNVHDGLEKALEKIIKEFPKRFEYGQPDKYIAKVMRQIKAARKAARGGG